MSRLSAFLRRSAHSAIVSVPGPASEETPVVSQAASAPAASSSTPTAAEPLNSPAVMLPVCVTCSTPPAIVFPTAVNVNVLVAPVLHVIVRCPGEATSSPSQLSVAGGNAALAVPVRSSSGFAALMHGPYWDCTATATLCGIVSSAGENVAVCDAPHVSRLTAPADGAATATSPPPRTTDNATARRLRPMARMRSLSSDRCQSRPPAPSSRMVSLTYPQRSKTGARKLKRYAVGALPTGRFKVSKTARLLILCDRWGVLILGSMRKLMVLSLAVLVLGVAGGAAATSASALTQVTCNGVNSLTYSPAVTNTPQTVTLTAQTTFGLCVSLTHPSIVSGTVAANNVTTTISCNQLVGTASPTFTITWNTGQTSTLTGNTYVDKVDGQPVVILLGSITSGLFAGATVTEQTVLTGDLTACLGPGLSATSGPAVLTIVGL